MTFCKRTKLNICIIALLVVVFMVSGCGSSSKTKATATDATVNTKSHREDFTAKSDYVKTVENDVEVHVLPDENSDVYITLVKGVDLNRTGYTSDWTEVLINGGYYYIPSSLVTKTEIKWATETDAAGMNYTIFIDPAKQLIINTDRENISPDTNIGTKMKMTQGGVGAATGAFEYEVNLQVAEVLEDELSKRGYKVILSRETNNVNISNAERAKMANKAGADIFIRIDAPVLSNGETSGILGFVTTATNPHSGKNYQNSYLLSYAIVESICSKTNLTPIGVYETDYMTVLNYCDMPATVIDVGFLSNINDDTNLSSANYKSLLAVKIADAIDKYFAEKR